MALIMVSLRQNGVGTGFTSADAILPKVGSTPIERRDRLHGISGGENESKEEGDCDQFTGSNSAGHPALIFLCLFTFCILWWPRRDAQTQNPGAGPQEPSDYQSQDFHEE